MSSLLATLLCPCSKTSSRFSILFKSSFRAYVFAAVNFTQPKKNPATPTMTPQYSVIKPIKPAIRHAPVPTGIQRTDGTPELHDGGQEESAHRIRRKISMMYQHEPISDAPSLRRSTIPVRLAPCPQSQPFFLLFKQHKKRMAESAILKNCVICQGDMLYLH